MFPGGRYGSQSRTCRNVFQLCTLLVNSHLCCKLPCVYRICPMWIVPFCRIPVYCILPPSVVKCTSFMCSLLVCCALALKEQYTVLCTVYLYYNRQCTTSVSCELYLFDVNYTPFLWTVPVCCEPLLWNVPVYCEINLSVVFCLMCTNPLTVLGPNRDAIACSRKYTRVGDSATFWGWQEGSITLYLALQAPSCLFWTGL